MKKKQPKDFYVNRAASDFRDLVEYFCCIRPRHQKAFQDDKGEFEPKKLQYALDFVSEFKKQTKSYKIQNAQRYRFFQKVLNDTFCIPTALIKKILGEFVDKSGKHHRITLAEVAPLVSSFCIKWTNHGHDFIRKGKKPSQTFCNKWRLTNKKQWYKLLSEDRDIFHESSRVAEIIRDFVRKERKTAETKRLSTTNTTAKNAEIVKETEEMTNQAIPHEDPPWVTATEQKAAAPQAMTAKPQKEESRIEAVSAAPDPARKARLISRIEDFANTGKLTRSQYRTMISTFYRDEPKPNVGRKMEDTVETLALSRAIYKKVLDNIAVYQIPATRKDLISSRLNLVSAWLVEKHKDEQSRIHN